MRQKKHCWIALLLLLLITTPLSVFSSLKLEQTYPSIPGTPPLEGAAGRESKPTPQTLLKYFVHLAIVVAILVGIFSLFVAGLEYLSGREQGKPEEIKQAKQRVFKSFLGLGILVCSYLILNTLNPQFLTLQLAKTPIKSAVVLLTEKGFNDLAGGSTLQELINSNEARYLNYLQINDLTEKLGDWKVVERDNGGQPTIVNFEKFELYALGFVGEAGESLKIAAFPERNFQGAPSFYTSEGKTSQDGEQVLRDFSNEYIKDQEKVRVIEIKDDFESSKIEFTDLVQDKSISYKKSVKHPPLSLVVEGMGYGVYLYSKNGEQGRQITSAVSDFNQPGFLFDDKAQKISLRNYNRKGKAVSDILAVLHDDAGFRGSLRIFFEKTKPFEGGKRKVAIPKIYLSKYYQGWETISGFNSVTTLGLDLEGIREQPTIYNNEDGFYLLGKEEQVGNVSKNSAEKVNDRDQYGRIDGASSIQIFELEDPSRGTCQEVRLCNQAQGKGYCLSFTNEGRDLGDYNTVTLPMPWYVPVRIPDKIKDKKIKEAESGLFSKEGEKNNLFANNIRSLFIRGNCLVALFENPVFDIKKCLEGKKGECWAGDSPGSYSQVFLNSVDDLSLHPIGNCQASFLGIRLGNPSPCASSIAVYPLKQ